MATKFTAGTRATIVASVGAGFTREEAASRAGISYSTLVDWLRRGKREPAGEHGAFRMAVLAAADELADEILTEDDVLRHLSRRARAGSVPAAKELLTYYRRERERKPPSDDEADSWGGDF